MIAAMDSITRLSTLAAMNSCMVQSLSLADLDLKALLRQKKITIYTLDRFKVDTTTSLFLLKLEVLQTEGRLANLDAFLNLILKKEAGKCLVVAAISTPQEDDVQLFKYKENIPIFEYYSSAVGYRKYFFILKEDCFISSAIDEGTEIEFETLVVRRKLAATTEGEELVFLKQEGLWW